MARDVPVVVTDGEQRASLAVVRSLGRAGFRVHVCACHTPSLAGSSRYAFSEWQVPDPLLFPDRYAEDIGKRVLGASAELLLPITEASLLTLLPRRTMLGDVRIPWPSAERVSAICDKEAVLERAAVLGIHVPVQAPIRRREALASVDPATLRFPLVLKPARSVAGTERRKVKLGVSYASTRAELEAKVRTLPDEAFPLLLQQRVQGPGVGVFLLVWEGDVLATFAHRRIREKPPSGGVSVYRESVAVDPELVSQSLRLLQEFEWHGVAMVEYKEEASTGRAYLMEVNGRFWGSLQLAVDAGVDFPVLLAAATLGTRPQPVRSYRTGVRSRWWWGDLDQLLTMWRRTPAELALPANSGGRWRALRDFLLLWRPGDRNEILRLSDPRPFFRESADWLGRIIRRSA